MSCELRPVSSSVENNNLDCLNCLDGLGNHGLNNLNCVTEAAFRPL